MESTDLSKTPSPPAKHDRSNDDGGGGGGTDQHPALSPSTQPPKPSSPAPAMKPPQGQEMDRTPSDYRIPPSVFERNKSSSPADWSAASNESLFSIHMGNMSFANDNIWKSGELGDGVPRPSTSEQMFSYSAPASGGAAAAEMRSRELGIAEATMLEVIKENEGRSPPPPSSISEVRNAHRSTGSNQSNMSFAFSVAGRDTERASSSVKSSAAATAAEAEESAAEAEEKGAQTQSKWSTWFPCCSFCS